MKTYKTSIFIFRRDLRLNDNTGLLHALSASKEVLPIFIFTPEQVEKNTFKSDNCIQFMVESLKDLDKDLKKKGSKMFYFNGKPDEVIKDIIENTDDIEAVFVNEDYTPYSRKRDKKIKKVCDNFGITFKSYEDVLLNNVKSILTDGGEVYQKFTPYFNKARNVAVRKITANKASNYVSKYRGIETYDSNKIDDFYEHNDNLSNNGGREEAMKIIKKITDFKNYNQKKDCLTYETTNLSAYNKFGCISIRELYHVLKKKLGMRNDLIKQLYWRDFYYNIAYEHPVIFSKKGNLKENYDALKWDNSKAHFRKWKEGKTGYPIVDACMRQMNKTGYMHNRGRLIVSSFLIKLLLIDWKWGEKYFAQTLLDYDPSVNTGNWGWASGSGADSQPYFRIFNPWLQSKKHDPNGEYIKKWVPELEDVPAKHLHEWDKYHKENDVDYPKPIIDYKKQKKKALDMYEKIF